MQNYEEMKAQVLTAIAVAVTAEEIKTEDEIVIFHGIADIANAISIVGTRSEVGFTADVHCEGNESVLCYFSFRELEEERERLLNKPEWTEDKKWQARACDADGLWFFYTKDVADELQPLDGMFAIPHGVILSGCKNSFREAIAFPAGYDWKESLEFRQS